MSSRTERPAAGARRAGRRPAHGPAPLHPSWARFIRFCRELGHGEVAALKIQDGLPVLAEVTTKKVKFS